MGAIALIGFVISFVVHVTALMGVDLVALIPGIWVLHVGIFFVCIPFVFLSRKELGRERALSRLRKGLPSWITVVGTMLFIYALANFFLFMLHTEGGNPAVQDGRYVLLNHGKLIRELTTSEFAAFKASELRGFSGHWLLFYFICAAYFLSWKSARVEKVDGHADVAS
ncbi:hypothetical protein L2Y90_29415 [Burkholderia pyrrocinia]|uniref:hypothetical protein n=1 Tax=Burkholderia pyrrocinia TaxID=60550 RepID=UPI00215AC975|nr:hypothetical protein [Burkholderia pyrrocinia]UVE68227.1 hypothetical protein L2Y90_29415 [Burkholderia pyrrocinia]